MRELGTYSLVATLIFALGAAWLLALGAWSERKDLIRYGYYAVYGFFLTTVIASAVLLQAFLKKDFSFGYVAENSDSTLSVFYRIAGFWAGQSGSFLLWLLFLAIAAIVIAVVDLNRLERLTAGAVAVLGIISAVFTALMVFDPGSNPFIKAEAGAMPFGLNPLLLHPAMVLHPPALFIGYVGLAVPFAFAVSTLLLGRGDKLWVQRSQKWAVFGWLFLSLGIGLGAWWAYVVLSFGGFWAWDPVENTSLVPWLTATALLHSFTLYKSRGLFKRWALGLAGRHLLVHHPRDVDHAHRADQLGPRVRQEPGADLDPLDLPGRGGRRQRRAHRLALAPVRQSRRGRELALARLPLLRHQPAAHAVRRGRRLRHGRRAAAPGPDRGGRAPTTPWLARSASSSWP